VIKEAILSLLVLCTLAPAKPFEYFIPHRYYTVELPKNVITIKYPIPPAWFNKRLLAYINKECVKHGVPILLVHKVIELESQWHQNSPSPNFDRHHNVISIDYNLMQVNSENLAKFAHAYKEPGRTEKSYDAIHNPYDNVHFGICYLRDLYDQLGSWQEATAAYNGGTRRVINGTLKDCTKDYVHVVCPVENWWLTIPTNYVCLVGNQDFLQQKTE
jgi:soluble lytic murein transglycosylase-like protein